MPVLTNIEKKSRKGIIFQGIVLLLLVVGGATMIYPFLLMLAGATRSPMDQANLGLVPDYLVQDKVLSRKFLERKYNLSLGAMNLHRPHWDVSFEQATIPERTVQARIDDLKAFADQADLPDHWWILGGTAIVQRTTAPNKHRLTERLRERYDGDLDAFGDDLGVVLENWRFVQMQIPGWTSPRFSYEPSPAYAGYYALLRDRPLAERAFVSLTGAFLANSIFPEYSQSSVAEYNAAHAIDIDSYQDIALTRRLPGTDQPQLRREWLQFVRELVNVGFVRVDRSDEAYRQFLRQRHGDIQTIAELWGEPDLTSFEQITLPGDREWVGGAERRDYAQFISDVEPEALYLVGPEFVWQDWLAEKYGDIAALNQAHQSDYPAWRAVDIPIDHVEHQYVLDNTASLRWEFATSNFRDVFNEVLIQGRPFINSIIYVLLSLLVTLTIQPLAAYGLSRFDPPGGWRIILLFMATMAFPPMVGMIPRFLILEKLNLLNTFIALILPVVVNGYMIFLLKGFFDSLPQYLYEAALIDGASELRMFWEITMSLSKPILAVVALQTFNHAWLAFMYPLLVAPDESMHVLAVWLYQFQQEAPTSAVFASILITSIPTLMIFVFTQRTIMRGIAVPAEK